jgi:hypothetical protein
MLCFMFIIKENKFVFPPKKNNKFVLFRKKIQVDLSDAFNVCDRLKISSYSLK